MTAPTAATTASTFSAEDLAARTVHRRAVEAAIWGIPIVNYDLMFQAFARVGGALNQIVYWSKLLDWKNQTTTPNPNSIYFMPFFDTAEVGPIVIEIPPADSGSITGTLMDCWQTAFEDVGPAGVDKRVQSNHASLRCADSDPRRLISSAGGDSCAMNKYKEKDNGVAYLHAESVRESSQG